MKTRALLATVVAVAAAAVAVPAFALQGGSLDGGPPLPPTDGLLYRTADGGRVVVRPSGTEPKLKCYLEAVVAVERGDLDAARAVAARRLAAIRADLAARFTL